VGGVEVGGVVGRLVGGTVVGTGPAVVVVVGRGAGAPAFVVVGPLPAVVVDPPFDVVPERAPVVDGALRVLETRGFPSVTRNSPVAS